MIRKVKTKTSSPGKASVKSSKPEKTDMLSIFSGSDEDSTENSKAFDNPQETRGQNSSKYSKIPDTPFPATDTSDRGGAKYSNPNFNLNVDRIVSKPKEQLSIKSIPLSEKAQEPLSDVQTDKDKISHLSNVQMSKPILEKYPAGENISKSVSSFPSDFNSELSLTKDSFNFQSLDQRDQTKKQLYQKVTEIQFQKVNDIKTELYVQSEDKIDQFTNPQIQADYFTSKTKESISSDFFTKGDLAPSNVFSEYSSSTAEYGKGDFPQTKEASSKMTDMSKEAAYTSSPQRAADTLSSTPEGKSQMIDSEIQSPQVSVDTSIKGQVKSALTNNLSKSSETTSLGSMSKSFFISNFSIAKPVINETILNSSSNSDSIASEVSAKSDI